MLRLLPLLRCLLLTWPLRALLLLLRLLLGVSWLITWRHRVLLTIKALVLVHLGLHQLLVLDYLLSIARLNRLLWELQLWLLVRCCSKESLLVLGRCERDILQRLLLHWSILLSWWELWRSVLLLELFLAVRLLEDRRTPLSLLLKLLLLLEMLPNCNCLLGWNWLVSRCLLLSRLELLTLSLLSFLLLCSLWRDNLRSITLDVDEFTPWSFRNLIIALNVCVEELVVWQEDWIIKPKVVLQFHSIKNLLDVLMQMVAHRPNRDSTARAA